MTSAAITQDAIVTINREFWLSMTEIDLRPAGEGVLNVDSPETITGRIEIVGEWKGSIEIHTSLSLARDAASAMMAKPSAEVTAEECVDAVREATNILAGSIKRLLPPVCSMSVPAVSRNPVLQPKAANPSEGCRFDFASGGHSLSLVIQGCARRSA